MNNRTSTSEKEHKQFVRECPSLDCRGFLSTQWKCGMCNVHVCKECLEIKGEEEHTCDPNILLSAQQIKKDSKSCPKCSVHIYRVSGCNQMWCTYCNTAFDWMTGKIVKGTIHNPHYFEYMAENPRPQPQPQPDCNPFERIRTRLGMASHMLQKKFKMSNNKDVVVELITHFEMVNRHNVENVDYLLNEYSDTYFTNMEKQRIDYIRNKISEKTFKSNCLRVLNTSDYKRSMSELLEMGIAIIYDILQKYTDQLLHNAELLEGSPSEKNANDLNQSIQRIKQEYDEEFQQIQKYINEHIFEINKTFKNAKTIKQLHTTASYILMDTRTVAEINHWTD